MMHDARAFERELGPLLGKASGYARSFLRSRHDAEDAIQQAALRGWERRAQYDATRPFGGWWFAILRNCCLDILRQRKSSGTQSLEGVDPADPREVESFDWYRLDRGLRQISEAHGEILRLKYFGELSYDEIAGALAIPRGTVMSRLHLARKALAAQMHEELP
jgi:RNA polymerase sigma-70 factor, ECF subfamily